MKCVALHTLLGDCLIDAFHECIFAKTEKIVMQMSIVYEMQFQIKDGPACLCFTLFLKSSCNSAMGTDSTSLEILQSKNINQLLKMCCCPAVVKNKSVTTHKNWA